MVLAGCGNSSKDMTFQETYNAFFDSHMSKAVDMFNDFASAPAIAEEANYNLSGSVMSGVVARAAIAARSTVLNKGADTDSTVAISGSIVQPDVDDTINLDSTILLKMISGQSYINLSKLSLTSAKGNPQISMIGAFSAILTNKWIAITTSGATVSPQSFNLATMYTLPSQMLHSLKTNPIFVEKSKEMVDGNPVYHVALDATGLYLAAKEIVSTEAMKTLLRGQELTDEQLWEWAQAFVANSAFDGMLTAKSKKDVELTINSLHLDKTSIAKGIIKDDEAQFTVMDATVVGTGEVSPASSQMAVVATASLVEKGDKTELVVSAPQEDLDLRMSLDMKKATSSSIAYLFTLMLRHPSVSLDLDGDAKIAKTDPIVIEAPASFETIDSLLGGFGSLLGGSETQ